MLRPLQALGIFMIAAAPATAATYSATPATPSSQTRIATRDVVWACGAQTCTGSTANSRPVVLCQGLAKQAGRLLTFTVNGRAMDAAQLERCNANAPAASDPALANAR